MIVNYEVGESIIESVSKMCSVLFPTLTSHEATRFTVTKLEGWNSDVESVAKA